VEETVRYGVKVEQGYACDMVPGCSFASTGLALAILVLVTDEV